MVLPFSATYATNRRGFWGCASRTSPTSSNLEEDLLGSTAKEEVPASSEIQMHQ